jgi:hypothetical protein
MTANLFPVMCPHGQIAASCLDCWHSAEPTLPKWLRRNPLMTLPTLQACAIRIRTVRTRLSGGSGSPPRRRSHRAPCGGCGTAASRSAPSP